jgi:hypothetical protein
LRQEIIWGIDGYSWNVRIKEYWNNGFWDAGERQKLKIYKTYLNSISYVNSKILECGDYHAHGDRV